MFTAGFFPEGYFAPGYFPKTGSAIYMLTAILDNMVTDVTGLNLTLNGLAPNILKRKGVKRQPGVEASSQITICKDARRPMKIERTGFGKTSVVYPIAITAVCPNPRDWVTNLDTYIAWWTQLASLYTQPLLVSTQLWTGSYGSNKVFDVKVDPGDFLEPDEMANMFDAFDITFEVKGTLSA